MKNATLTRIICNYPCSSYHDAIAVEYITAECPGAGATFGHCVVYHPGATRDGLDGLDINGTWFEDRHTDDMFCSEMFATLTGLYPYEVRELIPAKHCIFSTDGGLVDLRNQGCTGFVTTSEGTK